MNGTVRDVMTRNVVVISGSASYKEIVGLLRVHGVSALPVVDAEGRPIGVVSEADLLLKEELGPARTGRRFGTLRRRKERAKAQGMVADQLMSAPAITVQADTSLAEAARAMHARRVKTLPVVDRDGRLVGIVSRGDLLKVFLRSDDDIEHEVVRDVIQRTLWVEPSTIHVRVSKGVVTLEGQLERAGLIGVLVGLVTSVDGVVGVVDHLTARLDDSTRWPSVITPWSALVPGSRWSR